MNEVHSTLKSILSERYNEQETQRHMSILRPLWDENARGRLMPASEIADDSVHVALRSALNDPSVIDWRIMTVSVSSLTPQRQEFMTDHAHEAFTVAYRDVCYAGLRASTTKNIVAMLEEAIPGGLLRLLSIVTELPDCRDVALAECLGFGPKPSAETIRTALLHTYFGFAATGMETERKRIERLCEIASTKAVPYGLRKQERSGERVTFFLIAS